MAITGGKISLKLFLSKGQNFCELFCKTSNRISPFWSPQLQWTVFCIWWWESCMQFNSKRVEFHFLKPTLLRHRVTFHASHQGLHILNFNRQYSKKSEIRGLFRCSIWFHHAICSIYLRKINPSIRRKNTEAFNSQMSWAYYFGTILAIFFTVHEQNAKTIRS